MITQRAIFLDASLFSRSSCLLRVFYTLKGYTGKVNNNDIEFGTAFHIFKAELRKKESQSFALGIQKAVKYYRDTPMNMLYKKRYLNESFLVRVCHDYYEHYEKDLFEPIFVPNKETGLSEPLTEVKFAVPYWAEDDIAIILCGTIDEIGKWASGPYCASDTKTTASWDIEDYLKGYELSPQLMFYIFILKAYAEEFPDSIINKIVAEGIGTFIDGVFYSSTEETKFQRSKTVFFKDSLLKEFKTLLDNTVERIIFMSRKEERPLKEGLLNGSCSGNFRCPFFNVCAMPDDVAAAAILTSQFIQRDYQPLNFQTENKI